MKSRHIAVAATLGNAHLYPVLGLCSELVKRGHRVTFPVNDQYAPVVRKSGANPVPYRDLRIEVFKSFLKPSPFYYQHFWTLWASVIGPIILMRAGSVLAQIEDYYRVDKPDLVIYDQFGFLGRMLAARVGCPAVPVSPHFAPYQGTFLRENGIFMNPAPLLAFSRVLDCFLHAYGIKESNNLWHSGDLNIYFIPREFQVHGESFDERYCFVGPCLNRPTFTAWKNNSKGRPIVLVNGSQNDVGTTFFKTMIDAFSGSQYFVILSPGADVTDDAFGELPENFEVNRDVFNFQIMPQATLVISQGGTGTVMESLYYGVPVLVVPRTPLHAETAYRVTELHLGSCLPEQTMSPDAVKEHVARMLGDAVLADNVARMQKSIQRSGGAQRAANLIEEFLDRQRTA
jgi:glycosyltransferase, MGT family